MSDPLDDELSELLKEHPGVGFVLGAPETAAIVGFLQLAMRHPQARALESSKVALAVIDHLIEALAQGDPRVTELMQLGSTPPAEWN